MTTYANGRYRAERQLSTHAVICKDKNLDRLVTIHWVTPVSQREAVRSRLATLQNVRSPYVALIYDLVEEEDWIGVVEEELSAAVVLSAVDRTRGLFEFCEGLTALHEQGLAHGRLDADCFRQGPLGRGRLCNLNFVGAALNDPRSDRLAFAASLERMGAGSLLDPPFQSLRARLAGSGLDATYVSTVRDRLRALLLRDQHRALLHWRDTSVELGSARRTARFAHPLPEVASVVIEYDGTRFFIAESKGEVRLNNVDLPPGSELPGSCVIALGYSSRPWQQRYFITFDQSHPEVTA